MSNPRAVPSSQYKGIICWDFDNTLAFEPQDMMAVDAENPADYDAVARRFWSTVKDANMAKLVMLVLEELKFHSVLATQRLVMPTDTHPGMLNNALVSLSKAFGEKRTFLTEEDTIEIKNNCARIPGDDKEALNSKFYILEAIKNTFHCDSQNMYLVDDSKVYGNDLVEKNKTNETSYHFFHVENRDKATPGSPEDRMHWVNLLKKITRDQRISRDHLRQVIRMVGNKHKLKGEATALREMLPPRKKQNKLDASASTSAEVSRMSQRRILEKKPGLMEKLWIGIKNHKKPILWGLAGILFVGITIASWGIGGAIIAGTATSASSIAIAAGGAFPTLGTLMTGGALTGSAATGLTVGASVIVGPLLQFVAKGAYRVACKITECLSCSQKDNSHSEPPPKSVLPTGGSTTSLLRKTNIKTSENQNPPPDLSSQQSDVGAKTVEEEHKSPKNRQEIDDDSLSEEHKSPKNRQEIDDSPSSKADEVDEVVVMRRSVSANRVG